MGVFNIQPEQFREMGRVLFEASVIKVQQRKSKESIYREEKP